MARSVRRKEQSRTESSTRAPAEFTARIRRMTRPAALHTMTHLESTY